MDRKKTRLVLSLLLLLVFIPVAAFAGIDEIKQRNKIIVAMKSVDHYPYRYRVHGQTFIGLDVDMAIQMANKLGVKLEINSSGETTEEVLDVITRKEADVAIAGLKILLRNATRVIFSDPYLNMHYSLVVNRLKLADLTAEANPLATLQHSCLKLGVINDPTYLRYAAKLFPRALAVPFSTFEELIQATRSGKVLAALCDEVEGKTLFDLFPNYGVGLMYVPLFEQTDELGFAVSWDNKHLNSWLNLYLSHSPLIFDVDQLLRNYPLP